MITLETFFKNNLLTKVVVVFLLVAGNLGCSKDDGPAPQEIIKSSEKQITSFAFLLANNPIEINVVATIDEENKTITATMPVGTAVTALLPEVKLSDLANVDRTTVQDFTEPLEYTVTAEDGSEVIYVVTISNHIATYTLTSILSSFPLDPNVSGTFDDDELIDNIDCVSFISLNADNTFSWGFLSLNQFSTSFLGLISSYGPITCSIPSEISGQFEISNGELSFDAPILGSNVLIDENSIEVEIREELIIEQNDIKRKEIVNLTLIYEK